MPRYVLLFHECPMESGRESHWDFMLESGSVLRTWALSANPALYEPPRHKIRAQLLPDHRLAYLDYEGPISNGRGQVERVAFGEFQIVSETEVELVIQLAGEKLSGEWRLIRDPSTSKDYWLLR